MSQENEKTIMTFDELMKLELKQLAFMVIEKSCKMEKLEKDLKEAEDKIENALKGIRMAEEILDYTHNRMITEP
jgi:hypothetical protein